MKKNFLTAAIVILSVFAVNRTNAQVCDTIANVCARHIISSFISDGQQYRALLLNNTETAQFETTFFGETTYRIAACSGTSDGNLVFTVRDEANNVLFTNQEHQNSPYWDFKVKSTLKVIIEARLDNKTSGSGCAVLLIGFKQAVK